MATVAMRAKETALAFNRLIAVATELSEGVGIAPPSGLGKRYRNPDLAKQKMFQNLADWFEDYQEALGSLDAVDYSSLTVDELTEHAQKLGIYDDIEGTGADGNILKRDLLKAIEG